MSTQTGCIVFVLNELVSMVYKYGTSTMLSAFVLGLLGNAFAKVHPRPRS